MQKLAHQLTQAQFAEWMAADIDARRKGGPNCQAKYLELADQLPREIVAETKEKVIEVWSRLERELAPPMPAFMRELSPRKTYQELLQETLAKARDKTEPEASFFGSAAQPEAAPEPKDKPSEEQPKKLGVEEVAAKGIALLSASQRVQQWQEAYIPLDEYLVAMNERHAVIANVGGKCRVVEWVPSELDEGVLVPSFQSKTDFINRYAHRQVGFTRKGDPLTLGAWWFEHPDRADHRGVVFK